MTISLKEKVRQVICNYSENVLTIYYSLTKNGFAATEIQMIPVQEKVHCKHSTDADAVSSNKRVGYLHLIAALSKIANVHLAKDDCATTKVDPVLGNRIAEQRESPYQEDSASIKNAERSSPPAAKSSLKLTYDIIFANVSNNESKMEKFHCQLIQDVYIPDVQENVPSYKCKFGNRIFLLASKRFQQDRRTNLYVKVNSGNMFRKLYNPGRSLETSRFNIVPAALVLKRGHENYT